MNFGVRGFLANSGVHTKGHYHHSEDHIRNDQDPMFRLIPIINLNVRGSSIKWTAKASCRCLSISPVVAALPKKNKMPPRPMWLIKEDEIEEDFLKGGRGPGGQKINKSNSKVQLTHKPTGLVVTCQYSRSQEQNRKKAREILALKLEELENPENCRTAVINQRKSMVKKNKAKKSKKKYSQVEEERQLQRQKDAEELSQLIDLDAELDQFVLNDK